LFSRPLLPFGLSIFLLIEFTRIRRLGESRNCVRFKAASWSLKNERMTEKRLLQEDSPGHGVQETLSRGCRLRWTPPLGLPGRLPASGIWVAQHPGGRSHGQGADASSVGWAGPGWRRGDTNRARGAGWNGGARASEPQPAPQVLGWDRRPGRTPVRAELRSRVRRVRSGRGRCPARRPTVSCVPRKPRCALGAAVWAWKAGGNGSGDPPVSRRLCCGAASSTGWLPAKFCRWVVQQASGIASSFGRNSTKFALSDETFYIVGAICTNSGLFGQAVFHLSSSSPRLQRAVPSPRESCVWVSGPLNLVPVSTTIHMLNGRFRWWIRVVSKLLLWSVL
jgi:hypothetical protein